MSTSWVIRLNNEPLGPNGLLFNLITQLGLIELIHNKTLAASVNLYINTNEA